MWRFTARSLLRRVPIKGQWVSKVPVIYSSSTPLNSTLIGNPFLPTLRFLSVETSDRIDSLSEEGAASSVGGDVEISSVHYAGDSKVSSVVASTSEDICADWGSNNDFDDRNVVCLPDDGHSFPEALESNNEPYLFGENVDNQLCADSSEERADEALQSPIEVDDQQVQKVLSVIQSRRDESIESALNSMSMDLNEEFVLRVLSERHVLGENLIDFFKWVLKKMDFSKQCMAFELLVRAVSSNLRTKDAYSLWDLIKESMARDKDSLNTKTLNGLISVFRRLGKSGAALEAFKTFDEFGYERDSDTYYFAIDALCCRSKLDDAWLLCEEMLNLGKLPDGKKTGDIVVYFCKGSRAKDAHLVYLMAKEKNISLPKSIIALLISSLCRDDKTVNLGEEILNNFVGDARKYAIKPFSSVIRGFCRNKNPDAAKKLLLKMVDGGPPPGNAVFNSIINGFCRSGNLEEAISLMRLMELRGLRPDVYTYTVIVSGFARNGQMDEANTYFLEAKQKHSTLTPVTCHAMIRGYVKMENFNKAVELLSEMKEYGVSQTTDEYPKLIQTLCMKALGWRTAEELLGQMAENGLHLNGLTHSLISAVKELEAEELSTGTETIGATL